MSKLNDRIMHTVRYHLCYEQSNIWILTYICQCIERTLAKYIKTWKDRGREAGVFYICVYIHSIFHNKKVFMAKTNICKTPLVQMASPPPWDCGSEFWKSALDSWADCWRTYLPENSLPTLCPHAMSTWPTCLFTQRPWPQLPTVTCMLFSLLHL